MERFRSHFLPYQEAPDPHQIDVLDGVRALCVFLVGWFHIWQQGWLAPSFTVLGIEIHLDFLLRSGYIWVDGMLLLSGFLLYLPYTLSKNPPSLWPFYKKRLIRILPSYLLCIIPLFILALIQGKYASPLAAGKDLLAHLTFTHTLFPFGYQHTPLNGALWTLGVEMQFYLIFPFIARLFRRFPAVTWLAMTAVALAFRALAAQQRDMSMYFNQLPAFLDVYANGFAAAAAFTALRKKLGQGLGDKRIKLFFTILFFLCVCQLVAIAKGQAAARNIQAGQMERRFFLSVTLSCAMICAAFSLPALRYLLGNPVMKFLSAISFQFYIWHQLFAVQIKSWGFPPSISATPWMAGEYRWQVQYTLCCFIGALVLASLITYLFEKPIARQLRRRIRA